MVQAMRKTSRNGALTVEEQAALDAWLAPRIEALADELAARLLQNGTAPIGFPKNVKQVRSPS